jgi:signal recognition particle GTPase
MLVGLDNLNEQRSYKKVEDLDDIVLAKLDRSPQKKGEVWGQGMRVYLPGLRQFN